MIGEKKLVYISGPITGVPDLNRDLFEFVEKYFLDNGLLVINPLKLDGGEHEQSWLYYIQRDLHYLAQVDCVALLPGWDKSHGCMVEAIVAHKLGKEIIFVHTHKLTEVETEVGDWLEGQFNEWEFPPTHD